MWRWWMIGLMGVMVGCSGPQEQEFAPAEDLEDACVYCDDGKADAFGIPRESYLAYGIVALANTADFETLDRDVRLDVRAVRGIVAERPFAFIEELDTVSYVGRTAFSRMADYVRARGLEPFCGDGGLEPLLEACDDGNVVGGDGCSATCTHEAPADPAPTDVLKGREEVILGAEIGADVSFVEPGRYYFRQRIWKGRGWSDRLVAVMERADGIVANEDADDVVGFDELAILSRSPFIDALLPEERDALDDVWALFAISQAPAVVIDQGFDPVEDEIPVRARIERPGPFVIAPRTFASLTFVSATRALLARTQGLPGCNRDGDPETLEVTDIDKVLTDYEQVFTRAELAELSRLRPRFFTTESLGQLEHDGDFVLEYAHVPDQVKTSKTVAEFDGFRFDLVTFHHLYHQADTEEDYAAIRGEFVYRPQLFFGGELDETCGFEKCNYPFLHAEVRFVYLDDGWSEGRLRGVMVMERWERGERVYDRVIDFEQRFEESTKVLQPLDAYVGARPMLSDGTLLALDFRERRSGERWFGLAPTTEMENRTFKRLLPGRHAELFERLQPGRYEEFEGAVLDVHPSGALVVYLGGEVCPLRAWHRGEYLHRNCARNAVTVTVTASGATLSIDPFRGEEAVTELGGEDGQIGPDASYHVVP